jgi:hypothetical protein
LASPIRGLRVVLSPLKLKGDTTYSALRIGGIKTSVMQCLRGEKWIGIGWSWSGRLLEVGSDPCQELPGVTAVCRTKARTPFLSERSISASTRL